MESIKDKKKRFLTLYLSGEYKQEEMAQKLNVSRVTISKWMRDDPTTLYIRIRKNLTRELDKLSQNPTGKEELIFQYIQHLDILDRMIRKAKFLPKV
ncbi:MAG: helix-turn-helix domain-containing protein [Muribaculaceae bacterium]|nr:helix-turn-helix domain-containing protein [Muribaculaceae bacterium]